MFEGPADLVGRVREGDILMDANGRLLRVGQAMDPLYFHDHQRASVAGQHYLELFGTEIEYTPGRDEVSHDERAEVRWPLILVRVVPVEGGES